MGATRGGNGDWDGGGAGAAGAGGFRASRDRTLDQLAAAAVARDIARVQRLGLMTLSWWNGKTTPLPQPDERETYDRIKEQIPCGVEETMGAGPRGARPRIAALLRFLRGGDRRGRR